jgi:hypothetical protein
MNMHVKFVFPKVGYRSTKWVWQQIAEQLLKSQILTLAVGFLVLKILTCNVYIK